VTTFSHAQLEDLWTHQGGPASEANVAAAIAQAESAGDSTRIANTAYPSRPGYHAPPPRSSPEYSVGLWQINLLAHPQYGEAELLDPDANARAAITISRRGADFSAWTTYENGEYRQFLAADTSTGGGSDGGVAAADKIAAQAHRGWHAINLAFSRSLPASIYHSERTGAATAARLARRRK
jgi:hypothetical protein